MGIDQVLLLNTLCKQVRDEAQAQSQSLTSSSAVAVSMVVAAFLLGDPLSSSSGSSGTLPLTPLRDYKLNIPGRDYIEAGIFIPYSKTQWDNFGSRI